jgi:septum formation protein
VTGAAKPIAGSRAGVLVLASGSATRAGLLRRAGVPFLQEPATVDEAVAKARLKAAGAQAGAAALELARLKAEEVSARHPGALVLGADQLLDCEGEWLDKPGTRERAKAQLLRLSGRSHRLETAAMLVRDCAGIWSHLERPELRLRRLTPELVDAYLDAAGEEILHSVGSYQIEGPGVQLVEQLTGDAFAVLGLPLLPLLAALRREAVLP